MREIGNYSEKGGCKTHTQILHKKHKRRLWHGLKSTIGNPYLTAEEEQPLPTGRHGGIVVVLDDVPNPSGCQMSTGRLVVKLVVVVVVVVVDSPGTESSPGHGMLVHVPMQTCDMRL